MKQVYKYETYRAIAKTVKVKSDHIDNLKKVVLYEEIIKENDEFYFIMNNKTGVEEFDSIFSMMHYTKEEIIVEKYNYDRIIDNDLKLSDILFLKIKDYSDSLLYKSIYRYFNVIFNVKMPYIHNTAFAYHKHFKTLAIYIINNEIKKGTIINYLDKTLNDIFKDNYDESFPLLLM